ncbi:MAG TPA: hypothetical protein VNZ94_12360 [Xanthobacteraceae bacterium]|nr:hypothetical protein [Xanthobacteraceae bacterium]
MCDYSLHAVASRPAKVGETLISTRFPGTPTRGFSAENEPNVAVCLMPGTELSFDQDIQYDRKWFATRSAGYRVARFCRVDTIDQYQHRDALSFPDGNTVLLTALVEGQRAHVLQLPATMKEETTSHSEAPVAQPETIRTPDAPVST